MIDKVFAYVKANWGKVLLVVAALFALLETTGWGFLTKDQHQAILTFLSVFGG